MKRTERHHLKENEIERFTREAREVVDARRRELTALIIAIVVIGGAALGFFTWRDRTQSRAATMLADAMDVAQARVVPPAAPDAPTPPGAFTTERSRTEAALAKFKAAADAYPSTQTGIFARYQQAAALVTLGRHAEAATCYQDVIAKSGDGIYGQMAKLGLAEVQQQQGQFDQAINTFKDLAQRKDGPLPVDGILMQLGRTYVSAGKTADAQQTFNRLVQEYPDSPYLTEARQALDELKKT